MAKLYTEEDVARMKEEAREEGRKEGRKREREDSVEIRAGRFFAPISKIWKGEPVKFVPRDAEEGKAFQEICRDAGHYKKVKNYSGIRGGLVGGFLGPNLDNKAKKQKDKQPRNFVSDSSNSSAGSATASTGNDSRRSAGSFRKYHIFGKKSTSKAHLIPEEQPCQRVHGIMGQAVVGFYPDEMEMFKEKAEKIQASQQLVCGHKSIRATICGLVDFEENYIQMPPNHGPMYDQDPCWMVVPILQIDKMKKWTGVDDEGEKQGYWVLVIAGGHGEYSDEEAYMPLIDLGYNDGVERLPGELERKQCDRQDIRDATTLLRSMVKAMAETLVGRNGKVSPFDLFDDIAAQQKQEQKMKTQRSKKGRGGSSSGLPPSGAQISSSDKKKKDLEDVRDDINARGVVLPDFARDYDGQKVMKIYLDPEWTAVPDPMLLLVKAAITWSDRQGQKLLPACGTDEHLSYVPDVIKFSPLLVEDDEDGYEDDLDEESQEEDYD